MRARVWGCRSLCSLRGGDGSRYGRETSCVSLEADGNLMIFDAGSGIVPLGRDLLAGGRHQTLWLFLTHFHQDHCEGLASFAPAYTAGYNLNISGATDPDIPLQERIQRTFENAPPEFGPLQAELQLFELREEAYEILPGVQVAPFFANHPGTTLAFTVEVKGRKFVYCPDSEIYGEQSTAMQDYDERLGRLVRGADVLIHDGRYLDSDYQTRKNNGHSSWVNALNLAARNGVKRLVLFHHDDAYGDAILDRIASEAQQLIAQKGYTLECLLAREGLQIDI